MSNKLSPRFWVIIPAAGIGSRMRSERPKQYIKIGGMTILEHTVQCFLSHPLFSSVAIALAKNDPFFKQTCLPSNSQVFDFEGGKHRVDSVLRGLEFIKSKAKPGDWVWVHDAARPCLSHRDINSLIAILDYAKEGVLLGVPLYDSIKRSSKDPSEHTPTVSESLDRSFLWRAMTPQVFRFSPLYDALNSAINDKIEVTDESSAIEYCGGKPILVVGSDKNIKVTRPEDLKSAAETLLEGSFFEEASVQDAVLQKTLGQSLREDNLTKSPRVGTGFDVHAFCDGAFVTLGGVQIPYHQGLLAHSDGDVLLHAIMDALLGALALGDIGQHFPDTDPKWQSADSRKLLFAVRRMIDDKGYSVSNLDSTIIAESPKMAAYINEMQKNIASDLAIALEDVSVKATTTECLGFTGRKEGIACQATVMLTPLVFDSTVTKESGL